MEAYQLAFLADPKIHTAALRRALPVVRSRADAEDAVQDAALRALRYRNTLRPGVAATSWFMRIVSRAALDIVTSRSAYGRSIARARLSRRDRKRRPWLASGRTRSERLSTHCRRHSGKR